MITDEILEYVRSSIALGISLEAIQEELVKSGWGEADIADIFRTVVGPIQAASLAAAKSTQVGTAQAETVAVEALQVVAPATPSVTIESAAETVVSAPAASVAMTPFVPNGVVEEQRVVTLQSSVSATTPQVPVDTTLASFGELATRAWARYAKRFATLMIFSSIFIALNFLYSFLVFYLLPGAGSDVATFMAHIVLIVVVSILFTIANIVSIAGSMFIVSSEEPVTLERAFVFCLRRALSYTYLSTLFFFISVGVAILTSPLAAAFTIAAGLRMIDPAVGIMLNVFAGLILLGVVLFVTVVRYGFAGWAWLLEDVRGIRAYVRSSELTASQSVAVMLRLIPLFLALVGVGVVATALAHILLPGSVPVAAPTTTPPSAGALSVNGQPVSAGVSIVWSILSLVLMPFVYSFTYELYRSLVASWNGVTAPRRERVWLIVLSWFAFLAMVAFISFAIITASINIAKLNMLTDTAARLEAYARGHDNTYPSTLSAEGFVDGVERPYAKDLQYTLKNEGKAFTLCVDTGIENGGNCVESTLPLEDVVTQDVVPEMSTEMAASTTVATSTSQQVATTSVKAATKAPATTSLESLDTAFKEVFVSPGGRHSSIRYAFSVVVPKNWLVSAERQGDSVLFILMDAKSGVTKSGVVQIETSDQKVPAYVTLKTVSESIRAGLKQVDATFAEERFMATTVGKHAAYQLVGTRQVNGVSVRTHMYVILKAPQFYAIQGTQKTSLWTEDFEKKIRDLAASLTML